MIRVVLLSGTALLLVCARKSAPDAMRSDRNPALVLLDWSHQFQFAGLYAAEQKGFYKAHDVNVKLVELQRGNIPVSDLVAGRAAYGVMGSNVLLDRADGKPLVALAAIFQHSPYTLITRESDNLPSPTSLAGKRVMIATDHRHAEFLAMFKQEGVPLEQMRILEPGWSVDDLLQGRADAISGYVTNEPDLLAQQGVRVKLIRPINYGVDFYGDVLVTSEEEIRVNPRRVEAFRAATLEGWRYALEHREEVIDWILSRYGGAQRGLTREHLRFEAAEIDKLILPHLVEIGHMNEGRWRRMAETYADLGMLPRDVNLTGFLYEPQAAARQAWVRATLMTVFCAGLFALAIALWNLRLRQIVAEKTHDLVRAKERADEASRAKSRFLANMSHEIRTPLGAIMGFTDLALTPGTGEHEKAEYLQTIARNGEQLLRVIDDILDLTKVEAGRIEFENVPFSPRDLLVEAAGLFEIKTREKNVRLVLDLPADLSPLLRGDPGRIRQIILNIVGNALKFTSQGFIAIEVREHGPAHEGEPVQLSIRVRDSGEGLEPSQYEKIFQPFTQADSSTTRRFGGSGLGLTLSRELARLMNGELRLVESQPGKGSTFELSLPLAPARQEERSVLVPVRPPRAAVTVKPLQGLRLLVVDDAPDNRILVSRLLKGAGAEVALAEDGEKAVRRALAEPFDAILMDIQMPVLDGYEATAELRKRGFDKPIVALTAHAMDEERERCLAHGFDEHLSKPVNQHKLIAQLKRLTGAERPPLARPPEPEAHGSQLA